MRNGIWKVFCVNEFIYVKILTFFMAAGRIVALADSDYNGFVEQIHTDRDCRGVTDHGQ